MSPLNISKELAKLLKNTIRNLMGQPNKKSRLICGLEHDGLERDDFQIKAIMHERLRLTVWSKLNTLRDIIWEKLVNWFPETDQIQLKSKFEDCLKTFDQLSSSTDRRIYANFFSVPHDEQRSSSSSSMRSTTEHHAFTRG